MIERLNQISLHDFIEISCGNYQCLANGNCKTDDKLKECAFKLIVDYRNIVNPAGMRAILMDREEISKGKSRLLLLHICNTLVSFDCFDEAREILRMMDVSVLNMDDKQIKEKVCSMLRSAIFEQKRSEELRKKEDDNVSTPEQIRSSFDLEIAFLMTYFKMNIDTRSVNAAVYANILHQADMEITYKRRNSK